MSTFRDAINAVVQTTTVANGPRYRGDLAEAVLAMPEMEAIRSFIEWFGYRHADADDMRRTLRDEAHLPDNVVEWVVSHAFGGDQ